MVEVPDKKSGLFDKVICYYYNRAARSVKLRGLKGIKHVTPRYVQMEVLYTHKVCTIALVEAGNDCYKQ